MRKRSVLEATGAGRDETSRQRSRDTWSLLELYAVGPRKRIKWRRNRPAIGHSSSRGGTTIRIGDSHRLSYGTHQPAAILLADLAVHGRIVSGRQSIRPPTVGNCLDALKHEKYLLSPKTARGSDEIGWKKHVSTPRIAVRAPMARNRSGRARVQRQRDCRLSSLCEKNRCRRDSARVRSFTLPNQGRAPAAIPPRLG